MHFLSAPNVGTLLFLGLSMASFAAAFFGVFAGAAGGVLLLATMALFIPAPVLIPMHTVVMLGAGATRTMIMWRFVMQKTILPYLIGAAAGAALGAKVFIALPISTSLGVLGAFILLVTWMPTLGRLGAERGRFVVLGFFTTFVGIFVSATGSLLAPFVASAAPDRRNHSATLGALMMTTHIAKLIAFGAMGFAIGPFLPLAAAMIAASAAGNWVGKVALGQTSEGRFRLIFQIVLTVIALRLLWSAARGAGLF
ncbi:MAG: TSUP family transporter [Xanthobacteraceae bacterium]